MLTFTDIINRWPEPSPVTMGADLDEAPGTVRQWRNRDVLPEGKWLDIVRAAERREIDGVSLEVLARIAKAKSKAKAAA